MRRWILREDAEVPKKTKNIRAQIKKAQVFSKIARSRNPGVNLPKSAQASLNEDAASGRAAKRLKKVGRGRLV